MDDSNRVLTAVRLGWLTVEVFCRLRRYAQSEHRTQPGHGDAARRFNFSDRSLSEHDSLLLAMDRLRHTAYKLDPELPPLPLPPHDEMDHALSEGMDLDALQSALDDWGTEVWVALSTDDEVAGRGFTYGGSLADTYWQTDALGLDGFATMLRSQRLEYIAARFEGISEYLPPYSARLLHHTLHHWRVQPQIERLDLEGKKQALRRLESQAKVWRDLLFGSRSAESYLTLRDRRAIAWKAVALTACLVISAGGLVWFGVLILSNAGRVVTASMAGLPMQLDEARASFIVDLLDWQKWSALLATLSSVIVLITGFVTRLSGWLTGFHRLVKEWLKLRRLYRRTCRSWRS